MTNAVTIGYAIMRDRIVTSLPSLAGSNTQFPIAEGVRDPFGVVDLVAEHIASLASTGIQAVGIAVGGHVNPDAGVVVFAPDLAPGGGDWKNVEIRSRLQEHTGLPVCLDNDVNCMVYHCSKDDVNTEDQDNLIAVYLAAEGHGLGSGIIAGGSLLRGSSGGAGEFGHVIVQPTGARCRCGSRGCLEALLSIENIAREINWGARHNVHTLSDAGQLIDDADSVAISVFTRAGRNFGQGLAVLANLLNPASIIVGGPEAFFGDNTRVGSAGVFQKGFNDAFSDYAFSDLDNCRIVIGKLNPDVAASGAALMALGLINSAE